MAQIRPILGLLTIALILVACSKSRISVWEETSSQARNVEFPYVATLQRAESGDVNSIIALMQFHADAAGGLGHGIVLIELLDLVGEARFCEAIAQLSPPEKQSLALYLDAGIAYSSKPSLEQPLHERFPAVHAALLVNNAG